MGEDLNVQTEYQVNYGQPKNKSLQPSHNAEPKRYTVLQRDQPVANKQNDNKNLLNWPNNPKEQVCLLCNKDHATHRCLLTRQIRDGKLKPPQNFCQNIVEKFLIYVGKTNVSLFIPKIVENSI